MDSSRRRAQGHAEMSAADVLRIIHRLQETGAPVWIAGGWAIDALVATQTRKHNDVDIAFDAKYEERIIEKCTGLGFAIEDDARPTRFVLRHTDGREIDMHPVVFDATGAGRQLVPEGEPFIYPNDCFTTGTINSQVVPCLAAEQLLRFHEGYTPLEKDRHNMQMLHEYLHIPLPEPYT